MRGLSNLRRGDGRDRGAIAVTFTILLAGGVLMGMLALVIDVGLIYAEREELQSGADAAAIALAEGCAERVANCGDVTTVGRVQANFIDRNARDGVSAVQVCGANARGSLLGDCARMPDGAAGCAGSRPTGNRPFVEVWTRTELPSGEFALPPVFAASLSSGNLDGTRVVACARATWGTPRFAHRMAMSLCEWERATRTGSRLRNPPPYRSPPSVTEVVVRLHTSAPGAGVSPSCPRPTDSPASVQDPGGFGWLENSGPTGDCVTDRFRTQYSSGNLTTTAPDACGGLLESMTNAGVGGARVLNVPIYDRVMNVDGSPWFRIVGMAAFVPTGYRFGSRGDREQRSWLTGDHPCASGPGGQQCVYGYFVKVIQPGELGSVSIRTYGNATVSLAG